jgi:hypothetical protein
MIIIINITKLFQHRQKKKIDMGLYYYWNLLFNIALYCANFEREKMFWEKLAKRWARRGLGSVLARFNPIRNGPFDQFRAPRK